jgi:hypothetical protein
MSLRLKVKRPPRFGYLEVDPPLTSSEESIVRDGDGFDQVEIL